MLEEEIPTSEGTVTGVNKDYKATAKKGYVFTGWPVGAELNEDRRSTTVTFKTPGSFGADITIPVSASFTKVDEVAELSPTPGSGAPIEAGPFSVGSDVFPTVTVKGRPSGMKFDAKKIAFTGAPSMQSLHTVTVSAKNGLGHVAEQGYTLITTDTPVEKEVGDKFVGAPRRCGCGVRGSF